MEEIIKQILKKMAEILKEGEEEYYSELIRDILDDDQNKLWGFLVSNILWGGAGSIADQALLYKKDLRRKLEKLLIELGDIQMRNNRVNARTKSWLELFQQ